MSIIDKGNRIDNKVICLGVKMLSLNSTILCSVFTFLDVKDLTYLDSAYTSSEYRDKLLHIWKEDWLDVFNVLSLEPQSTKWIIIKGLQPLNFHISDGNFMNSFAHLVSRKGCFPLHYPTRKVRNLKLGFNVTFVQNHSRSKTLNRLVTRNDFKNVRTINYYCVYDSMDDAAEDCMDAFPTCTTLHLKVENPQKRSTVFEQFCNFMCTRTEVTVCSWTTCDFTVRLDLIKMKIYVESNEWARQNLPTGKVVLRRNISVLCPISGYQFYGRAPIAPDLNLRPPILQLLNTFKIKSLELSTKYGSRDTASLVYFAESLFLPMELTELKQTSVVFSVD